MPIRPFVPPYRAKPCSPRVEQILAFNILKAKQTDTLNQDRYRAALVSIKKLLTMLAVS